MNTSSPSISAGVGGKDVAAVRKSHVEAEISNLRNSSEALRMKVSTLRDRLSKLIPVYPQTGGNKADPATPTPTLAPLAEEIRDINAELVESISTLETIITSIEL